MSAICCTVRLATCSVLSLAICAELKPAVLVLLLMSTVLPVARHPPVVELELEMDVVMVRLEHAEFYPLSIVISC
jgi:hypothetical protein